MSDFAKTMREWQRMCNMQTKQYKCMDCPLCEFNCVGMYEMPKNTDWRLLQEKVDAWAAENPEPVYPTWAEWLIERGLAEYKGMVFHEYREDGNYVTKFDTVLSKAAYTPIPADIAEKLGLKPKGENGDA